MTTRIDSLNIRCRGPVRLLCSFSRGKRGNEFRSESQAKLQHCERFLYFPLVTSFAQYSRVAIAKADSVEHREAGLFPLLVHTTRPPLPTQRIMCNRLQESTTEDAVEISSKGG